MSSTVLVPIVIHWFIGVGILLLLLLLAVLVTSDLRRRGPHAASGLGHRNPLRLRYLDRSLRQMRPAAVGLDPAGAQHL
jgi:hypothetical protein